MHSAPPSVEARVRAEWQKRRDGSLVRAALNALFHLIDDVVAAGEQPVIVFDLDSTLFHTAQRNFIIFKEFIAHFGQGSPELLRAVDILAEEGTGWNIADDVARLGVSDGHLLQHLRQWWRERFFTNEYLRYDLPVPGSPEFVRACYERGSFCYYLTGRDAPNMKDGTLESLWRHGFPMGPRSHLHMKASFREDDLAFKRAAVEDIRSVGRVVGAFENEPANLNMLHEAFPDAIAVFLETMHSPGAPSVRSSTYRVKDFMLQDVLDELPEAHSGNAGDTRNPTMIPVEFSRRLQ